MTNEIMNYNNRLFIHDEIIGFIRILVIIILMILWLRHLYKK